MKTVDKIYNKNHIGIISSHIKNNIREYMICSIIFLLGVCLSIILVNNLNEIQDFEIKTYINEAISNIKENGEIDTGELLKTSIQNNVILASSLWIMGSTVIGLLLVYLILGFKGFCFGYTLSTIIHILGTGKGILFFIITMFLKNILAIPATIALAVSGMKLYKSIMQDRRRENIKLESIRHTIFSILMLLLLIVASFLEVYVSQNILKYSINWF